MAWIWILVLLTTILTGLCSCEKYYQRTPHHPELNPSYPLDTYDLGQIAGLAILDLCPLIFHRGTTIWTSDSFNDSHRLQDRVAIEADPLVLLDHEKGTLLKSWGSGLFYMPHGVEVDAAGNVWVTDVGLHQVMKFPANSSSPSLVLGTRFEPGSSNTQFCQPADVAVCSKSGAVFVADGYCNSRVMKFDADGRFVAKYEDHLAIPHSLALLGDRDLLCIADRENERIVCIAAGLHGSKFGEVRHVIGGVGRVYGIAGAPGGDSGLIFAVGGQGNGLTVDLESGQVVDVWGGQFLAPHDVAIGGGYLYVGETGPNRLTQFYV